MSNPLFKTVRLPGDGLELAADAFGDPSAPPVLFFHGGGQSRRSWRGSAARIAQAGYYALTFDLRGHGESGWATDGDRSEEHTSELQSLMRISYAVFCLTKKIQ